MAGVKASNLVISWGKEYWQTIDSLMLSCLLELPSLVYKKLWNITMLWMGKSAISTGPWLQQQTVTAITRGYIHINPIYFPLNPMKSPFDPMIPGDCSIQGLKSPHGSGYPPLQPSDCRCLCLSYPSAPCMVYLAALNHFCMHINVDKRWDKKNNIDAA